MQIRSPPIKGVRYPTFLTPIDRIKILTSRQRFGKVLLLHIPLRIIMGVKVALTMPKLSSPAKMGIPQMQWRLTGFLIMDILNGSINSPDYRIALGRAGQIEGSLR